METISQGSYREDRAAEKLAIVQEKSGKCLGLSVVLCVNSFKEIVQFV